MIPRSRSIRWAVAALTVIWAGIILMLEMSPVENIKRVINRLPDWTSSPITSNPHRQYQLSQAYREGASQILNYSNADIVKAMWLYNKNGDTIESDDYDTNFKLRALIRFLCNVPSKSILPAWEQKATYGKGVEPDSLNLLFPI